MLELKLDYHWRSLWVLQCTFPFDLRSFHFSCWVHFCFSHIVSANVCCNLFPSVSCLETVKLWPVLMMHSVTKCCWLKLIGWEFQVKVIFIGGGMSGPLPPVMCVSVLLSSGESYMRQLYPVLLWSVGFCISGLLTFSSTLLAHFSNALLLKVLS